MPRGIASVVASFAVCIASIAAGAGPTPESPACPGGPHPRLLLETHEGVITIELDEEAAPMAVARIVALAHGPVFNPDVTGEAVGPSATGYFDGLEFDHVLPGAEVGTAIRPPKNAIRIPVQIDAVALGLDRQTIETTREAMRVWQHEILPYEGSLDPAEPRPEILIDWMERWRRTMQPDFLVGASRADVNRAQGYVSTAGLPSIPVRRGTVIARPLSREWATPGLSIVLRDRPELDGRRMVVGRVVEGLELADRLSRAQLTPAKRQSKRPLVPVRITDARIECPPVGHTGSDENKED